MAVEEIHFDFTVRQGVCRGMVREVLAPLSERLCDDEVLSDLELALTEALSNVINHAYAGHGGPVQVVLRLDAPHWIELCLSDQGERPDVDLVRLSGEIPDQASEHGRGLFLLHALSDEVRMEHTDGHNRLTLRKLTRSDAWKYAKNPAGEP